MNCFGATVASKNAVKFEVGSEATLRKMIELAFVAGCDKARWFRPERPLTYMDMAEAAAVEYATTILPRENDGR
jgi:hypothetical protein